MKNFRKNDGVVEAQKPLQFNPVEIDDLDDLPDGLSVDVENKRLYVKSQNGKIFEMRLTEITGDFK